MSESTDLKGKTFTRVVDGSSPTEEQVMDLFGKVGLCKCSKRGCTHMAFDPATLKTNREGKCEPCFMDKLNADFAKEQEKESKMEAALDAKMKAKGYTHKVVAWVHPPRGDDYQLIMHTMGKPSDADIKKELKKARSRIDTDYIISEL